MEIGEEQERVHVKPQQHPFKGGESIEDAPDFDAPAEEEKQEELQEVGTP